MSSQRESKSYAKLGASSSKEGVLSALGARGRAEYFVELSEDIARDPQYFSLIHADGVGTKSIVAYLAYRETGDLSWFRSLAYDSLIMNLDDVACVGAFEGLLLSNTIGRNRHLVPDGAVQEIIEGYRECAALLAKHGVAITLGGGETADVGDLVRTLIVDSTLTARVKRSKALSTRAIAPGDLIIGISSTGQAVYESKPNSGLGSNGYTLARHALIARKYADKYPEILDPALKRADAYLGKHDLFTAPDGLSSPLAEALLSPTRTYAPLVVRLIEELERADLHGLIHCTGGGQTKILRFGSGVAYVKDNLFPVPPIFRLIRENADVPWQEMYAVFNMGHRLEIILAPRAADSVAKIASSLGLESKVIGRVEPATAPLLTIKSEFGEFNYR